MRIAILNREPSAFEGGDLVAIQELRDELARINVESQYLTGQWTPADLAPFDLVHIFHSNFSWSMYNFSHTWTSGKPYVITPVFYPDLSLGMNANEIREAMVNAKAVMPFSTAELLEIRSMIDVPADKFRVLPNGTNAKFFRHIGPGPDSVMRKGVLAVAARDGDKNTDKIRAACALVDLPFTLATHIKREKMPEVYADAKVFINASGSERMSLTIGEALCSNCRVLATTENRGNEWYTQLYTFDPSMSIEAMAEMLKAAYRTNEWNYRPNRLAQALQWPKLAWQTKLIYEEALACS